MQMEAERNRGSYTYIRQNRLLTKKTVTRVKEGYYIMIKGSIHLEDITLINIHAPNRGTPKYLKQILTYLKREINFNTIILGDFNIPLSTVNGSHRLKINKKMNPSYVRADGPNRCL